METKTISTADALLLSTRQEDQRPRLGERVTFEIGTGKDGKQQAKSIVCPTARPKNLIV